MRREGARSTTKGLSLLELLVAFLQPYIFTFLTTLFVGMAIEPSQ